MKRVYNLIKYLGYYEIFGGVVGILFFIRSLLQDFNWNAFYFVRGAVFVALCSFSIYCGMLLIRKKYLKGIY